MPHSLTFQFVCSTISFMAKADRPRAPRVRTVYLRDGRDPLRPFITVPSGLSGFRETGEPGIAEMEDWRRAAIRETVAQILPHLIDPITGGLLPKRTDGVAPYYPRNSDKREGQIAEETPPMLFVPGLGGFTDVRRTFRRHEHTRLAGYRGGSWGELVYNLVVAEGFMAGHGDRHKRGILDDVATTRLTRFPSKAVGYALHRSGSANRVDVIFEALQLGEFGFTPEQVADSILMSPVVSRISREAIRENGHHVLRRFRRYPTVYPPVNENELTAATFDQMNTWTPIDLREVARIARETTARFMPKPASQ